LLPSAKTPPISISRCAFTRTALPRSSEPVLATDARFSEDVSPDSLFSVHMKMSPDASPPLTSFTVNVVPVCRSRNVNES
jgi:hypothetical protein